MFAHGPTATGWGISPAAVWAAVPAATCQGAALGAQINVVFLESERYSIQPPERGQFWLSSFAPDTSPHGLHLRHEFLRPVDPRSPNAVGFGAGFGDWLASALPLASSLRARTSRVAFMRSSTDRLVRGGSIKRLTPTATHSTPRPAKNELTSFSISDSALANVLPLERSSSNGQALMAPVVAVRKAVSPAQRHHQVPRNSQEFQRGIASASTFQSSQACTNLQTIAVVISSRGFDRLQPCVQCHHIDKTGTGNSAPGHARCSSALDYKA